MASALGPGLGREAEEAALVPTAFSRTHLSCYTTCSRLGTPAAHSVAPLYANSPTQIPTSGNTKEPCH